MACRKPAGVKIDGTDSDELDENGIAYAYHAYAHIQKIVEEGRNVTICLFTSEDDE